MIMNRKALQPSLIISPMPLFMKTLRASLTLWRRNDVRKFDVDATDDFVKRNQWQENKHFNV